jgi:hypothetical protein
LAESKENTVADLKIYYLTGVILATAIIAFIVLVVLNRQKQQRAEKFRQAAEVLRLNYFENDDGQVRTNYGQFVLFSHGRQPKYTNIATGQYRELPLYVFDYQYKTGSGESSHGWRQTVVAVCLNKRVLPAFLLRPAKWLEKISQFRGKERISFNLHSDFEKMYFLSGCDEDPVRSLFPDQVISYFENHPGWTIEGKDDKLIAYRLSRRVKPEDLATFLQECYEIFALFKTNRRS